jgi:hypothetical protein
VSRPRVVDTEDGHRVEVRVDATEDGSEVLIMLVHSRNDEIVAVLEIDPADLRYLLTGEG